jgi:murein DD-endopeptidase MepM/ murein hydrolase activator NlpD
MNSSAAQACRGSLFSLGAMLCVSTSIGDSSVYKYRDADGKLVYSEQKPATGEEIEAIAVPLDSKTPRITLEKTGDAEHWQLRAVNECLCAVEFEVRFQDARNLDIAPNARYQLLLDPQSARTVVQATHQGTSAPSWTFSWKGVLGMPGAQHTPPEPYRVPFAVGSSYRVAQTYPMRFTHNTPDSQYAVDLALPDETPVYAARDGLVINLRHDSFRGSATPVMLDEANMIEILHDDGTIAVYAHLHWDSVRVHPRQRVMRGEYIADSGNTGFSTGPHLHFAVIRNAGMEAVSVPIQFAGAGGAAVTPQPNMLLTAY